MLFGVLQACKLCQSSSHSEFAAKINSSDLRNADTSAGVSFLWLDSLPLPALGGIRDGSSRARNQLICRFERPTSSLVSIQDGKSDWCHDPPRSLSRRRVIE